MDDEQAQQSPALDMHGHGTHGIGVAKLLFYPDVLFVICLSQCAVFM